MNESQMNTGKSNPEGGTGILGGTFDPVHVGHIEIARAVYEHYGLSRVCLIPAFRNPLRTHEEIIAGPEMRLVMASLAVIEESWLFVDPSELKAGCESQAPSYTIATLEKYSEQFGDKPLVMIVGADNLVLQDWHRIKEFPDYLERIAVVSRPGFEADMKANLEILKRELPGVAKIVDYLPILDLPVSATAIRESLLRGVIPPDSLHVLVELFIRKHGLYGLKGEMS